MIHCPRKLQSSRRFDEQMHRVHDGLALEKRQLFLLSNRTELLTQEVHDFTSNEPLPLLGGEPHMVESHIPRSCPSLPGWGVQQSLTSLQLLTSNFQPPNLVAVMRGLVWALFVQSDVVRLLLG